MRPLWQGGAFMCLNYTVIISQIGRITRGKFHRGRRQAERARIGLPGRARTALKKGTIAQNGSPVRRIESRRRSYGRAKRPSIIWPARAFRGFPPRQAFRMLLNSAVAAADFSAMAS